MRHTKRSRNDRCHNFLLFPAGHRMERLSVQFLQCPAWCSLASEWRWETCPVTSNGVPTSAIWGTASKDMLGRCSTTENSWTATPFTAITSNVPLTSVQTVKCIRLFTGTQTSFWRKSPWMPASSPTTYLHYAWPLCCFDLFVTSYWNGELCSIDERLKYAVQQHQWNVNSQLQF